ncbi:hypothetical protein FACS1894132_13180 [Clostridia bacterium]|nr:hypothetical protein FACS1894132_13180 [Clostridia bacterium]
MKRFLLVIFIVIFLNSCLPHVDYPKENHKTYMTANESIYFYTDFKNGSKGKFKTSEGIIYEIGTRTLGRVFEITDFNAQTHTVYYNGGASYEEDKFTFKIKSRKNDIDPNLPNEIIFYEHDGEVIPDWAK